MTKIVVIGLGYVGLPISVSFSKKYKVYGFDIDKEKIEKYKMGIDVINEVGDDAIRNSKVEFTSNEDVIKLADFIIVTVPTPVDINNKPDLTLIKKATEMIARNMNKGCTVIYESTVYPGATEEVCLPILESISGLKLNDDFFLGYSPERINPGDKNHTFETINKVVAGSNEQTTENIAKLYQKCLKSEVVKVSSIKVAEAAKIIENTQRDINIAFMNEVAKIFHLMDIDTNEVLKAAGSKWNFLNFHPGLVGGHCIGVDPFYLIHKSQELGYTPEVITSSRKVNDSIDEFIFENIKKTITDCGKNISNIKVLIKGLTFKENITDIRNSRAIDVVKRLKNDNIDVYIEDYNVDNNTLKNLYNLTLSTNIPKVDVVVFAAKHKNYYDLNIEDLNNMFNNKKDKIIFDIYSIYDKNKLEKEGFKVWNL